LDGGPQGDRRVPPHPLRREAHAARAHRAQGRPRARPPGGPMKPVMALVRPNKVDDVPTALEKLNLPGLTVTEVRGHGRQRGHTAMYRGREYDVHLLPKVKIETVVPSELVDPAIEAITAAARTGEMGDGRVFVIPVERSRNIRTGETETA